MIDVLRWNSEDGKVGVLALDGKWLRLAVLYYHALDGKIPRHAVVYIHDLDGMNPSGTAYILPFVHSVSQNPDKAGVGNGCRIALGLSFRCLSDSISQRSY